MPTPDQTGKELLKEEDFYFYDKEGNVVNSLGSSISNGDFLFMDDSLVEYTSKGIKLGDSLEQVEEAYRDVGGLYEYTIEEEGKVPRISYKSGDKILRMDFENGELKNCFISTERNDKIGIFLSGCENYYQRDIGGDVTINDEFQKHSKWMKMLTREEIEVRNKIADHADTLKYEDYTQWTTTNGMISVIYKDHNPYSWLTAAECETLKGMYQKFENNYEFEY